MEQHVPKEDSSVHKNFMSEALAMVFISLRASLPLNLY